jgi:glycosyltransferase involved in cell wall biosynthesis
MRDDNVTHGREQRYCATISPEVRRIGIYRTAFPLASEPFIVEQARALRRYEPLMLARTRCGHVSLPVRAVSDGRLGRARTAAFALTGHAGLFGALPELHLVHAHFGPDGVYGGAIARRLAIPYLVTFHGFDATVTRAALWQSRKAYAVQFLLRERQLQRTASAFIAISKFIAARLRDRGYPHDRIIQHYIGVDTERFQPAPRASDRYVLSVGRAVEKKGIATVLRAFARVAGRHPGVRLVHVGDGPQLSELRALAARLGIAGSVELRGARPHDEVVALMRGATVFALASCTAPDGDAEGLGIVFNEASACAVPVVATRHGGIPEAVLHGETGLLSEERDDIAMAEHLDVLLRDRALAERLGARGREYVCDAFDLRRQTARLEEVYDQFAI